MAIILVVVILSSIAWTGIECGFASLSLGRARRSGLSVGGTRSGRSSMCRCRGRARSPADHGALTVPVHGDRERCEEIKVGERSDIEPNWSNPENN